MRAFITGLAGPALTDEERGFLREAQPWGFILFKRNVTDAAALRRLIDDARAAVAREAPVLIDQERGRGGRARGAVLDRRGGRPRAAAWPAALAGLSAWCRLRRALRAQPRYRPCGGAARGAVDRGRSRTAGHRCRLPPHCRRAGWRRQSGDRKPCLQHG